ncbi:ATP-dependent DNA ligase [Actinosynnema pretiosum subsp. pretiosum]|uniref:Probable DNA ligase n=1 Tax=Actinosynnema pretiosum subsp. pretiosum TaxID=103721 RepID=A0AA45LCX5_9PSEU|nr:ATP-dependent DNA ligase [Actinosynnema pretiosum subsp. pretiosum]QUF07556.1 ATP-dependent DNA ligase [Actinosynnema pretiosum subsp. pretiosum]
MLFSRVVEVSAEVGSTRSRLAKVSALAGLLRGVEDTGATGDTEAVVSFLVGVPRQGRIGAGFRTARQLAAPPADEASLRVSDVDGALGEFAAESGRGSAARRAALLATLFAGATADEQDFLKRLLTGELRQGALEGVMLDAVARAAGVPGEAVRRAFMLSGELPSTAAAALRDGVDGLARFRLEVGRPVRPMLASPAESLEDALAGSGPVVVEHKLDGARIQVHRDGDEVRVFTRTLREITRTVPELVELARGLPCRSVVLDGETLALRDDGKPRPFQETMSRFGAQDERELLLSPFFFDCLHLDGDDLLDRPLRERLAALRSAAGRHVVPGVADASAEAAAGVLRDALAGGHEGVVVKDLDAPYAAGRRGGAWRKVKPVHTLDLVVLGVEWGSGRREGLLSNLHLGARDPDGGPPVMVGKTFKGLTDELLAWQTRALLAIAEERGEWVVRVRPELVVEIELDGAQVSPRYPGGVALRFARVVRYRPDKTAAEADTLDAVRAMLPERAAPEGGGAPLDPREPATGAPRAQDTAGDHG